MQGTMSLKLYVLMPQSKLRVDYFKSCALELAL